MFSINKSHRILTFFIIFAVNACYAPTCTTLNKRLGRHIPH